MADSSSPTFFAFADPFANHLPQSILNRLSVSRISEDHTTKRLDLLEMEVYKRLVGELEEMGFSKAMATKAICSGNSSIEDAINWIVEHENDTADSEPQTPMAEVLVDVNIEESDGFHISEDVKLKAKELRNQARKRKAELERKLEREREKERIRAGKELLEAKRMAEESERKRFLSQNKAEKDEERRARQNIRQKLQQDKLERREMLGLPREAPVPVKVKPETAEPQITKKLEPVDPGLSPVKLAAVRDNMRECLRSIKRQNKDDNAKAMRAFKTLLIYVTNIFNNPDKDKLRKIRISNPLFQEKVGKFEEGIEFLELCGFERVDGGKFLLLPRQNVDIGVLMSAAIELHNASRNPFFGLLSG